MKDTQKRKVRDNKEEEKEEEENGEEENGEEEEEQVIQGSHMVSGTRCPAWSDQLKKWEQGSGPKGPMSCRTQG